MEPAVDDRDNAQARAKLAGPASGPAVAPIPVPPRLQVAESRLRPPRENPWIPRAVFGGIFLAALLALSGPFVLSRS